MITTAEYRNHTLPSQGQIQQIIHSLPHLSEIFWFLLSFVLFVIMGPFAAPIALFVVCTAEGKDGAVEPEAIDCI